MSYESERNRLGRQGYTRVEIDFPVCALNYGVSPCAASGTTGNECKNSHNTCHDRANYDGSAVNTISFCDDYIVIPGESMYPLIVRKRLSPTLIDKKKSLGRRANIEIKMRDTPTHDRDIDKYWSTRQYKAEESGTLWGKIKAIYRYYSGASMRVITGYIGDVYNPADSITRNYILDEINGPKKGVITLIGLDILKLADDKRALCPEVTTGKIAVEMTLTNTLQFVISGGAGQYPVSGGSVRIEDEILSYSSGVVQGDDFVVNAPVLRAQNNTLPETHDANSTVQICKVINDNVVDFVIELLVNYGNVPVSYIPVAEFEQEKSRYLSGAIVQQLISKPEGVTKLIEELAESFLFKIWSDDIQKLVHFKATSPFNNVSVAWGENGEIIDNSINVIENNDDRLSRVIVHYNPRNPINYDKTEHFRSVYASADGGSESDDQYGDTRIKFIFARFINTEGMAVRCAGRTLSIFKDVPKTYTLFVDAKDSYVSAGNGVRISSIATQDENGSHLHGCVD